MRGWGVTLESASPSAGGWNFFISSCACKDAGLLARVFPSPPKAPVKRRPSPPPLYNMGRIALILAVAILLSSCAIHQFAPPSRTWTARNGQLSYHGKKTSLIGEVFIRYSNRGDFELTFSKGPGVTLLVMRTDPTFARVQGPLARIPWSGPLQQPPARASGWLALRQEILRNPQNRIVRVNEGSETFVLRF